MSPVFLEPEALPLLLLPPLAWLALRRFDVANAQRLADLAGTRLRTLVPASRARRRGLRRGVASAGLLLAALAVLQPAWGDSGHAIEARGVDIVVCLDVSRSMLARDARPNRLERARAEIRALAQRAKGDRIGLVAFAGDARLVVPLTRDTESLERLAAGVDTLSVERGGTDLGAAIDRAFDAFETPTGDHEAIVVLTDGDDRDGRGLRAAERCRRSHVAVHCVGLGTRLGSKIPVAGPHGEDFLRDEAGREVVSALDAASLGRIADASGGAYVAASDVEYPLIDLYESRILPASRAALAETERSAHENRFQWPLLAAFLFFALDLALADRRPR